MWVKYKRLIIIKNKTLIVIFSCVFIFQSQVFGQAVDSERYNLYIDFPAFDTFNYEQGYSPLSMRQSLAMVKNYHYIKHYYIDKYLRDSSSLKRKIVTLLFDSIPYVDIFLHEEWHRTVLKRRSYKSRNGFLEGKATHVKDEDLINLKRLNPAEQVRLSSSGMESEFELVLAMQKEQFLFNTRSWNAPIYWIHYFTSIGYLAGGNFSSFTEDFTQNIYDNEDHVISKRDPIGYDPTAWVYDLFRHDEKYENRGIHPSGVGVDRYITTAELSEDEKKYLKKQTIYSMINFLDPHLYGVKPLVSQIQGKTVRWIASPRHMLTPFGHTLDINVFLNYKLYQTAVTLHNYQNYKSAFYGVDMTTYLNRFEIRTALWTQPKNQNFYEKSYTPGGLISLRYLHPLHAIKLYLEFETKSEGWVAGNVYLDGHSSVRIGFIKTSFRF